VQDLDNLLGQTGRKYGLFSVLFALVVAAMFVMPVASPAAQVKQLLVIHSHLPCSKRTDDVTRGIASDLQGEGDTVKVRHEYLDVGRAPDPYELQLLRDRYRHRFAQVHFDAIITTGNGAFEFIKTYRDDLFPGTPVVFCGVEGLEPSLLRNEKLFTGVIEKVDIKATIDLALKLHPDTQRIAVINDTSPIGLVRRDEITRVIPGYRNRVAFVFLDDLAMPELLESVRKLGQDSLVLYSRFSVDKSGATFEDDQALSLLARECRVPIYGVSDRYLGSGIVGGMLTSGYGQGETAARMAVLIMHGEKVENLPVIMGGPKRYMFDYRQIEHFKIDPSALPQGSLFINEPSAFFPVSRSVAWGTAGLLAVVVVLIAFLLYKMGKMHGTVLELTSSVSKYQAIADNTYNWEFWLSPEGYFLYSSPSCQRITGHTAEEFYADPGLLPRIVCADDRESFEEHRHDSTWKLGVNELEFRIVHHQGDIRRIQHFCQPVFDDTGKFLGTRGSNTDITQRKISTI